MDRDIVEKSIKIVDDYKNNHNNDIVLAYEIASLVADERQGSNVDSKSSSKYYLIRYYGSNGAKSYREYLVGDDTDTETRMRMCDGFKKLRDDGYEVEVYYVSEEHLTWV